MTDLTNLINTLKEAQEAFELIQKWKTFLFDETDMCLANSKDTPCSKIDHEIWVDSYNECRDILYALGLTAEWQRSSETYKKYHKPN